MEGSKTLFHSSKFPPGESPWYQLNGTLGGCQSRYGPFAGV